MLYSWIYWIKQKQFYGLFWTSIFSLFFWSFKSFILKTTIDFINFFYDFFEFQCDLNVLKFITEPKRNIRVNLNWNSQKLLLNYKYGTELMHSLVISIIFTIKSIVTLKIFNFTMILHLIVGDFFVIVLEIYLDSSTLALFTAQYNKGDHLRVII